MGSPGAALQTAGEVAAAVLLLAGLAVATVSAVGVVRFREPMGALHAAGLASGLGVVLVLLASVGTGDWPTIARAGIVGAFLLVTSPVAEHIVALTAKADATDPDTAGEAGTPPSEPATD